MGTTDVFLLLLICSLSSTEEISLHHGTKVVQKPHHSCLSDIYAALREMSATLGEHKVRIEQLETKSQASKVAFAVALVGSGDKKLGPVDTDTTVVYKHVFLNIGSAYNSETGSFTAPVTGVYHFEIHVGGYGDSTHPVSVALMKSGVRVILAYETQPTGFGSTANAVTLLLEAGDTLYVQITAGGTLYDNVHHHNSFSGHLLFAMQ